MAGKSNVLPVTTTFARQCKDSDYTKFFAESLGAADGPPTNDSSTEDSSTEESEDDEDREFVVKDEFSGSEEEYFPHDHSSEDEYGSVSSNSDVHYALSDDSDDEYDLDDIHVEILSDTHDASIAKEKRRHAAELGDPLQSPSSDGPAVSVAPTRAGKQRTSPVRDSKAGLSCSSYEAKQSN
jgi:hypothetical protein